MHKSGDEIEAASEIDRSILWFVHVRYFVCCPLTEVVTTYEHNIATPRPTKISSCSELRTSASTRLLENSYFIVKFFGGQKWKEPVDFPVRTDSE